jgi:hypothetical protein
MDDIKIIEDLLPAGYANAIEHDLTKSKFPWYYVDDVTNVNYGNNSGFVHVAYDHGTQPSDWYPFIKPIIYNIEAAQQYKIQQLFRIRVGLLLPSKATEYKCNTPHVDFLWPHYTACYYVNDSDGDTVLFDKMLTDVGANITDKIVNDYTQNTEFNIVSRCTPKKNSICIFNGLRFHASSKPLNDERRLVITINYV